MKVTNIVRVFLVALSVIVLASCSGVVQEQYVQSLSDRTLCERWSGTGPGLRLFEEIEREKSQRKLNCSNLGFSVSKDAIRQSNEAQASANAERQRSERLGTILQGIGGAFQNSSPTSTLSNPTSGLRLLRRRINTPDISNPDQTITVYCEYSNGRIVPYYDNVWIQCPAVP